MGDDLVTGSIADERYVVISADGHAGADVGEYRPYLEARWHKEFDAWAAAYEVPYEDLAGDLGTRNWDSKRRLADLEADGQVAEVIFPNTIPPFFPKTSLTAQPPAVTPADAERRWAGLKAHNRWLLDFCNDVPGRRAGIIQINLLDIEASVAEVRWAAEAGMTGGVLLPGAPPGLGVPPFTDAYYEPLWSVCEETGMPINHHGGSASPPMGPEPVDAVVFLLEVPWWTHRALTHLMVAGVFERHPALQLVFTEQGTAWVPAELAKLDYFWDRMGNAVGSQEHVWGHSIVSKMELKPSEYWARQCHVGASFMRPAEVGLRDVVGVDSIMWGSDYPHKEASTPYSTEALRVAFAGVPRDEVQAMVGGNAAELFGFDFEALKPLAQQVGPRIAEIAEPLGPGMVPKEADKCPAFVGYDFAAP